MSFLESLRSRVDGLQRMALGAGVIGSAAAIFGFTQDSKEFWNSYLLAFIFCGTVPLGCLGLSLLHTLSGGAWGVSMRRVFSAGMRTLPLTALFFIVLVVAVHQHQLYEWTDTAAVAKDAVLTFKSSYLNETGFILRGALYFAIWIGLAYGMSSLFSRYERTRDEKYHFKAKVIAGPGLILFSLCVNFASVDWGMSLEPKWFSTLYGVIYMVGEGLSAFAFTLIFASWLAKSEPYSRWMNPRRFHDIGKLMFAFTLLWAYTTFAQFVIIWSGNLPNETPWYLHRGYTTWKTVATALIVLHFALPFLLLLSRKFKKQAHTIGRIATWILFMRWVDIAWLILPSLHPEGFHFNWMYIATPIGMGGLWFTYFLAQFKGRLALAPEDHYIERTIEGAATAGH